MPGGMAIRPVQDRTSRHPAAGAGAPVCSWTDVGTTVLQLITAIGSVGLPQSFFPHHRSGWNVGIYRLEYWSVGVIQGAKPTDHFDIVACPALDLVPTPSSDFFTYFPIAQPPSGPPVYIWVMWDTVPDPPPNALPPVVGKAFNEMQLPAPVLEMSPSSVEGIPEATVVNFPTWFWIDPAAWRNVVATASGDGVTATVWATPTSVQWQASWDFTSPSQDPERSVNQAPTSLQLACDGPGTAYTPSVPPSQPSPDCGTTFTQATFGKWVPLSATIVWKVSWAISGPTGMVGGEGTFPDSTTKDAQGLRVLQVESVVTSG